MLRTANRNSKFTGSYKKVKSWCKICTANFCNNKSATTRLD